MAWAWAGGGKGGLLRRVGGVGVGGWWEGWARLLGKSGWKGVGGRWWASVEKGGQEVRRMDG